MYIILDEKINNLDEVNGTDYSINTYMKRFFTDNVEELSGRAYKNYSFGDTLYFYEIKDSLNIKNLDNGMQEFKFKLYSEINYKDLVTKEMNYGLILFKFVEKFDDILKFEFKEKTLMEIINNNNFMDLVDVYEFLINKRKDYCNDNNFDNFMSLFEELMIEKSKEDSLASFCFYKLLSTESVNKDALIERYKSIILGMEEISQELFEISSDILIIKDLSIAEDLLLTYVMKITREYYFVDFDDRDMIKQNLSNIAKRIDYINSKSEYKRFSSVLEEISKIK